LFQSVSEKARTLFYTNYRVFLTPSSGTGLQEAAVLNFALQTMLACVNGAFGNRWYEVGTSHGKRVDKLEAPWNQPITAERVFNALKERRYEVLTLVHNETSTGLENPVEQIAAAAHDASPDTLICVDAVSSLGGVKIDMDSWGLDMVLTSSQKCLALPPGLALCAVSDRALVHAESVPHRGWYFDLLRMEKHRLKDSTPTTPAISLIYALDRQLERISEEGLERRFARHRAMAKRVQSWVIDSGLGLYAPEGYRSQTVTTAVNHLNLDVPSLNRSLLDRGMRIANGYGRLKGDTFRIAHMGETQMEDIEKLLAAIDDYRLEFQNQ
jgi:aspartate aminotransferase-like enzyme